MMSVTRLRPSAAIAIAATAFLAACSSDNSGVLTGSNPTVALQVLGASSQYIIPGTPAGTFEGFDADGIGRGTGEEFWDNGSDDGGVTLSTPKLGCAIGFYAIDRVADCNNETSGSDANAAGNAYTYMYADQTVLPAAFSFNTGTVYSVSLRGAYSGGESVVGYYTKKGGAYTFFPQADWSAKDLSASALTISVDAESWGFFIAREVGGSVPAGGCGTVTVAGVQYTAACSDATGGQVSNPLQQFALFGNANGTSYLVGAEDKSVLNGLPNDADYNDYIWSVTPVAICDFMTFGRTQFSSSAGTVVISGNAGGYKADGTILGTFNIQVGGKNYMLQDITSYSVITSGPLSGLTNSRLITGTSRHRESAGETVELRLFDGGEPGNGVDRVYLKVGSAPGTVILNNVTLNRGNIQYHPTCRGPGSGS